MILPQCPDVIDIAFMRELLEALGADVSALQDRDDWRIFGEHYLAYREQLEDYFEKIRTGNTSKGAFLMVLHFGSSPRWAERVIENATTGDPAWYAALMTRVCGSSPEWAERVIENAKVGDPACAAYAMYYYGHSTQEWAGRIQAAWYKRYKDRSMS